MIDTLKLSKRLTAANMPTALAEALSEGLREGLSESYVAKADIETLRWMVGGVYAILVILGATSLWLLLRVAAKVGALG